MEVLGAPEMRELAIRVRDAFSAHRAEIDALNVFPIPDGDTGTNLYLTARSAVEALGEDSEPHRLAHGAVRGARGNSGVIFSQVVRAFTEAVEERGALDGAAIAEALAAAQVYAYEAVAKPVEGTMLSAIRSAAEAASRASAAGANVAELLEAVCVAVDEAVARTPEQLAVLRDAGVVDAGARGFAVFCTTLAAFARGEVAPVAIPPPVVRRAGPVGPREVGSLEYRYEVQYLLSGATDDAGDLRKQLEQLGDSVVVVGDGEMLNVHVHTNEIGAAIETGLLYGRPSQIEVTAFDDAIESASEPEEPEARELGCVCVLPGPGLRELAETHGATVVDGAAGRLPSVADLLDAIGRSTGEHVIVLPGHKNAVPTAEQAAQVSAAEGGRPIAVVARATSAPRVLAALAVWDPDGPIERVVGDMEEAAGEGSSGEIVAAVRDADTPVGPVREGQFLAVCDGEVESVHDDPVDALRAVATSFDAASAEIVMLVVGDDVDESERERAVAALRTLRDGEVDVIDGRQRPARYLLGVE